MKYQIVKPEADSKRNITKQQAQSKGESNEKRNGLYIIEASLITEIPHALELAMNRSNCRKLNYQRG